MASTLARDVEEVQRFLEGYARMAPRGEVATLQERQCSAIISRIEHAQNLDVTSARSILEQLAQGPWSDSEKQRLSEAVAAKMSSSPAVVPQENGTKTQVMQFPENYLTAAVWEAIMRNDARSLQSRLWDFCCFVASLDLTNPDQPTQAACTALFHLAAAENSFDALTHLDGTRKLCYLHGFKETLKVAAKSLPPSSWSTRTRSYPATPADWQRQNPWGFQKAYKHEYIKTKKLH